MMKKSSLLCKGFALFCGLFLFADAIIAQNDPGVNATTLVVTSDKTVTIPSTATTVIFEAWGGGGAGGYVNGGLGKIDVAGGGGGGAYARKTIHSPNIASEYNVTIGKGGKHTLTYQTTMLGLGRIITNAESTHGGATYVSASGVKVVEAAGGKTVMSNSGDSNHDYALGGSADDCIGDEGAIFSGGRGGQARDKAVGAWAGAGGGGGAAGIFANGGDALDAQFLEAPGRGVGGFGNPISGDGGVPHYSSVLDVTTPGDNGKIFGGGGAGAIAWTWAYNGGAGANGAVRITIITSEPQEFVCGTSTVSDGNMSYETIDMNGVCWMRENLQTNVEGSSYYNDDPNLLFGRLYNWEAASNVCPTGWALPTVAQVEALYANGEDAIKSDNPEAWVSNLLGTNTTGFNAVGAGMYSAAAGEYQKLRGFTAFWTADGSESPSLGSIVEMTNYCDQPINSLQNKDNMYSVRCVRVDQ